MAGYLEHVTQPWCFHAPNRSQAMLWQDLLGKEALGQKPGGEGWCDPSRSKIDPSTDWDMTGTSWDIMIGIHHLCKPQTLNCDSAPSDILMRLSNSDSLDLRHSKHSNLCGVVLRLWQANHMMVGPMVSLQGAFATW